MESAAIFEVGAFGHSLAIRNRASRRINNANVERAEDIGIIVFLCPATQLCINSGIHTNWRSYLKLRRSNVRVYCRHCQCYHKFDISVGRLASCWPSQIDSSGERDQFEFVAMWAEG